jgi:hypothetical protein
MVCLDIWEVFPRPSLSWWDSGCCYVGCIWIVPMVSRGRQIQRGTSRTSCTERFERESCAQPCSTGPRIACKLPSSKVRKSFGSRTEAAYTGAFPEKGADRQIAKENLKPAENWINKKLKAQGCDFTAQMAVLSNIPHAGIVLEDNKEVYAQGIYVEGFDTGMRFIHNGRVTTIDTRVIGPKR